MGHVTVSTQPRKKNRGWVVAVVIIAVLAAATGGWLIGKSTDSSASASITLIPRGTVGPDPFTRSITVGRAVDFPTNVRAVNSTLRKTFTTNGQTRTLVAVGTTPGLYGGSNQKGVCDTRKLVAFLKANPSKAQAWASVFGIRVNQIDSYVARLTPVLLTNDTLVTNHGYTNGKANPLQSVLQAGTAVMVDATGTPRIKCNCGNPLTPPAAINVNNAHTIGDPWPGYTPATVTTVKPGKTTDTITLVDIHTGHPITHPLGEGDSGGGGEIHKIDFLNHTYAPDPESPKGGCLDKEVTLVNGKEGPAELYGESYSAEVSYADVTGDGEDDAIVGLTYNSGGSVSYTNNLIFEIRDGATAELGCLEGDYAIPARDTQGRVVTWSAISNGSVSRDDAIEYDRSVFDYEDGEFVRTSQKTVPIGQFHAETGR